MKKYAISYDLNKQNKNYDGLISEIKNFNYIEVMKSMWFVKTNFSAYEIYSKLKPQIDNNDFLFISEITSDHMGFLRSEVVNWLKS